MITKEELLHRDWVSIPVPEDLRALENAPEYYVWTASTGDPAMRTLAAVELGGHVLVIVRDRYEKVIQVWRVQDH